MHFSPIPTHTPLVACPVRGNIQGQFEWGSEEPDLAEDIPAHCGNIGSRKGLLKVTSNPNHSMILDKAGTNSPQIENALKCSLNKPIKMMKIFNFI